MMVSDRQRLEDTIEALSDELTWGLRYFYAAETLFETKLRITPSLFDTFYYSCLDQAGLILTRLVLAKASDDSSINLQYLANQMRDNPSIFDYVKPVDVETLIKEQTQLLDSYKPTLDILKDQRDRNLAHLDRRHVNDPNWRQFQAQLDLFKIGQLYQALVDIMATYHRLFYGGEVDFGDWEDISRAEVQNLIDYYEAYQSKA